MSPSRGRPSGPSLASPAVAAGRPKLADTFRKMQQWPFGRWLFGRIVCWKAPYFSTIAPRFTLIEPERCDVEMRHRRAVRNHIGTVHAIALCNLAELAAGVMMEATTPRNMRWIPKGMTVEYLAKATGTMHAVARPIGPVEHRDRGYELPVAVEVRDAGEAVVFHARIAMWISPRPSKRQDGGSASGSGDEKPAASENRHVRNAETKPP